MIVTSLNIIENSMTANQILKINEDQPTKYGRNANER